MRPPTLRGMTVGLICLLLPVQPPSAPDRSLPLYVTVTSPFAQPIPRLTSDDFVILDNGRPVPVQTLSEGDQPVALSVVFDLSGDMFFEATRLLASAETLLQAMPIDGRPGMMFTHRSWRPSDPWRSMEVATRISRDAAARRLGIRSSFGWPLWSACEWAMQAVTLRRARRVLVVVTDGPTKADRTSGMSALHESVNPEEGLEEPTERELLDYVDREDVLVYAIGFEGSRFDDVVKRLAVRSGGRVILLTREGDLNVMFQQIAVEVRAQHVLRFTPPAFDGQTHVLSVQLKRPESLTVRARSDYKATSRPVSY